MAIPTVASDKKENAILKFYNEHKYLSIGIVVGIIFIIVGIIIIVVVKSGVVQQSNPEQTQTQADLTSGTNRPSIYDPQVIKATLSQKITSPEQFTNVMKALEQAKEEDITDAEQKEMVKKYKSLSPAERSGLDNYMKEGGKKKTKLNKKQREVANVMIKTLSIDSAEMKNSLTENMENAPEGPEEPDGGPDNTNLGDQDKKFDPAFLADVNKVDFKVSPSLTEQMKQVGKFGNLKDSDVAPLYEAGTNVTNATKFRSLAKTLKEVCDFCNGKKEKTLDHDQAMLDKIEQVKNYLKPEDYDQFKKAFKDATNRPPPSTLDELKNFNAKTKKFSIQDLPLLESLFNANDPAIKTNPHLTELCAILPDLKTLGSLVTKNQNKTDDLSILEQLLKLRDDHAHLIVDTELNAILNGSKDKVPPGTVITEYITLTDVTNPVEKEKIWNAGVKLLKLLPYLNITGADKRIQDFRTNAATAQEDLIVNDLTAVMIKLNDEANASPPPSDKADKEKRIEDLFKVILDIKPKMKADYATAADYLRSRIVTLTFNTEKDALVDGIFNRLKDVNCADPKDVSPFTAQIQSLIKNKAANPSIVDSDIKNTPEDTFKEIVKIHVIPKLLTYLKAETKKTTFGAPEYGQWEQLIKKIQQIDPTNVFDKVKSFNLVAKATNPIPLANVIELWNLPHYDDIIEMDFSSAAGKLDFNAANAGEIINTLKTIQLVPQKVDILKADAIQGASLGILENDILKNITKIETAYLTLTSTDQTCNLIEFKNLNEVKGLGGLTFPPNSKMLKDAIKNLVSTFMGTLTSYTNDTANEAKKIDFMKAAEELIYFESSDNISDFGDLDSNEKNLVDWLLVKKYAKPSDFIHTCLERMMAENSADRQKFYQALHQLGVVSKPWEPSFSTALDAGKYKIDKGDIMRIIFDNFVTLDPAKIMTTTTLDNHCLSLIQLRKSLSYSFDPVEPAFDIDEPKESVKLKIMEHVHDRTMDALITNKPHVLNDANKDDYCKFMVKYLNLSQTFKDSLPDGIKNISDETTMAAFFDIHLPAANLRYHRCVATIAKDQLLTAVLDDLPKDKIIADLNKCIKSRLLFGHQHQHPSMGSQRIAKSLDEKYALIKAVTEEYLFKEEAKLIAQQLVDRIVATPPNLNDEVKNILKGGQRAYEKLATISNFRFDFFEKFRNECYRYALSIIGNESLTKPTTKEEIKNYIDLLDKFRQIPDPNLNDVVSKEAQGKLSKDHTNAFRDKLRTDVSDVLIRAELMMELFPKFQSAAYNPHIDLNLRSMPTLNQALSSLSSTVGSPADEVREFWKYKMAIWYLSNRKFMDLAILRKSAYDVGNHKVDASFKIDVEKLRISGKFDGNQIVMVKRVGSIDASPLYKFLNALVYDYKTRDNSGPFIVDDEHQFIIRLLEIGTMDVVKEAILMTDPAFELGKALNERISLDEPDYAKKNTDVEALVTKCVNANQVELCSKLLAQQILADSKYQGIYMNHIYTLAQKDLERRSKKKLEGIPSLLNNTIIKNMYKAFISSDQFPDLSKLNDDGDYNTLDPNMKKEFWDLFKQYVNAHIKPSSISDDYKTLYQHLTYHQRVLIFLKRTELYIEICKEGAPSFGLNDGSTKVVPPTSTIARQNYFTFLQLTEQLEFQRFPGYESVFDTTPGLSFVNNPTFTKFLEIANGIDADSLVNGLKAYVNKRKELFSDKYINDPLQMAINSMMDAKISFIQAKVKIILATPKAKALFEDKDFSKTQAFKGESEAFVNEVVEAGKLDQKFEEAFNNLLIKVDESEPVLPIKTIRKPRLSKFFCFAKGLSILRRLENLPAPSSTSSAEDRIEYCYFYKTLDFVPSIFSRTKIEQELEKMFETVKDGIFVNERQRPFLDKYVQVHRLTALFKKVTDTGTPILERSSDGKLLNLARIEPAEVGDEIEKMPLMSDPSFRSALASFIKDNGGSIIVKKTDISNELQHTMNPDISPDLNSYKDLLDEEVRKRVYDLWITI